MKKSSSAIEVLNSKIPVLCLTAFMLITNIIWLHLNTSPPTWDSAGHLALTIQFSEHIPKILSQNTLFKLLSISNYYPPFVYIIGALLLIITGQGFNSILILGSFFLIMAIIYLYLVILERNKKNHSLAFLASVIFSLFPQIWSESRQFHLDIPLTALMLATYYYLLKSQQLKSRFYSLLFFLFLTFSQLTKWYAFVYLLFPLYFCIKDWKPRWIYDVETIKNILLGSSLFLVGVFPWYLINFNSIVSNIQISATGELGDPANLMSIENFMYYLKLISSQQITFLNFLLLVVALINFRKNQKYLRRILIFIIFPYIIFSLIQNKNLRYILPLTPIFAFVIANFIVGITKRRILFQVCVITFFLVTHSFLSYSRIERIPKPFTPFAILIGGFEYRDWVEHANNLSYNKQKWPAEDVIDDLINQINFDSVNTRTNVLELSEEKYYSLSTFSLLIKERGFQSINLVSPQHCFSGLDIQVIYYYLLDIDYAIIPDKPGPIGTRNYSCLISIIDYFRNQNADQFELISHYQVPDGNTIKLYKKVK